MRLITIFSSHSQKECERPFVFKQLNMAYYKSTSTWGHENRQNSRLYQHKNLLEALSLKYCWRTCSWILSTLACVNLLHLQTCTPCSPINCESRISGFCPPVSSTHTGRASKLSSASSPHSLTLTLSQQQRGWALHPRHPWRCSHVYGWLTSWRCTFCYTGHLMLRLLRTKILAVFPKIIKRVLRPWLTGLSGWQP